MEVLTIKSINSLMETIEMLYSRNESRIWFRGQPNAIWDLIPSVQRSHPDSEHIITNDFYIRVKQILPNPPQKENYSAWLSMMQHYWLPTRLLDWSMSPLIAMYFAVENYFNQGADTDACIWCLRPSVLNEKMGFGSYIYPSDAYTVQRMLVRAFKEKEVIEPVFEDKIIACCSVQNDLRMYSQQSAFTVHNTKKKLVDFCDDETLYKIIIPSYIRKDLLKHLDFCGINQGFIYPDMEHIALDIRYRR